MPPVRDKVIRLTDVQAQRLERLAEATGTTEDALISKALSILFENGATEEEASRKQWSALSLKAFDRVWNNDEDAIYDNWKELYGISKG